MFACLQGWKQEALRGCVYIKTIYFGSEMKQLTLSVFLFRKPWLDTVSCDLWKCQLRSNDGRDVVPSKHNRVLVLLLKIQKFGTWDYFKSYCRLLFSSIALKDILWITSLILLTYCFVLFIKSKNKKVLKDFFNVLFYTTRNTITHFLKTGFRDLHKIWQWLILFIVSRTCALQKSQ